MLFGRLKIDYGLAGASLGCAMLFCIGTANASGDTSSALMHDLTSNYATALAQNTPLLAEIVPAPLLHPILVANAQSLSTLHDAPGSRAVWQTIANLRGLSPDSLLQAELESARLGIEDGDIKNASTQAQSAAMLAHRIGDERDEAEADYHLTRALRLLGDVTGALDAATHARTAAEQAGDAVLQVRALTELATLTKNTGDYIPSLKYEMEAQRIELAAADRATQAETLTKLAKLYEQIEDNTRALDYIERARTLAESNGTPKQLMRVLVSYANILNDIAPEQNQRTLDYAERSLQFSEASGDRTLEVDARLQLARAKFSGNDLDGAASAFAAALALARNNGQTQSVAHVLLRQGELFERRGRLNDAIADTHRAIAIYRASENQPRLIKSYAILERQLDSAGDHQGARDARLRQFELRDRVLGASAMRGLAQIEADRQQETQRAEIALLKQQGEIDGLRLQRVSLLRLLAAGAAVFLALALALTILRFRRAQRTNSLLHGKNEEILTQQEALQSVNTELKHTARSLFVAMSTDGLTGASSRKYGLELLTDGVASAMATGGNYGVLLIDVDHFKQINDRFGHLRGDSALASVASHLRARLREHDVLVRFGGEEFLVLLPGIDPANALRMAESLRRHVEDLQHDDLPPVTVSIGVCTLSQLDRCGTDALIEGADRALYKAKAAGRNCVANFDDTQAIETEKD